MKKIFIVHGWEAAPNNHWFPWLKNELETRGFKVSVLPMPNTVHPKLSEWLKELQKQIGTPNSNVYMVGHSLGGTAVLRYLESLPENEKIGGAVLVATPIEPIGYDEIGEFLDPPFNFEKIKQSAEHITLIYSDDDPVVPYQQGKILESALGATLFTIKNGGHFNASDGFLQLPEVLDAVLQISKKE